MTDLIRRITALALVMAILIPARILYAADGTNDITVIIKAADGCDTNLIRERIIALDPDAELMADFRSVMTGFAATLDRSAAELLYTFDGVEAVYASRMLESASVEESDAAMSDVADIAEEYAYRGDGMVAAVIDTSFDVNHEMFALSDESKVAITKADIMSAIDGQLNTSNYFAYISDIYEDGDTPYVNAKIPYAFDYVGMDTDVADGSDHGTHVAGIIAANNKDNLPLGFNGVAPEAQLLLMKVAKDGEGTMPEYAIFYAMDDAMTLGADVVNMSFSIPSGSDTGNLGSYDYIELIEEAAELGIMVVSSAGNSAMVGEKSNYDTLYGIDKPLASNPDCGLVGNPSTTSSALSVASVDSEYITVSECIIAPDGETMLFKCPSITVDLSEMKDNSMAYVPVAGQGSVADYTGVDVKGKIALVMRGGLTFIEKIANAYSAGAAAVIIYNSETGADFTMELDDSCKIPAVSISYADGMRLVSAEKQSVKFILGEKTVFRDSDGLEMSYFTSRGPTANLALKPELTAFGGNVYSSVPGGYSLMSGTSMSSPYVSGAALLIKQMLAEKYSEDDSNDTVLVRRLLMSTAQPLYDGDAGCEYSPRLQGAGLIDIDSALDCTVTAYASSSLPKVELGDGIKRCFEFSFTVRNYSDSDAEYVVNASVMGDSYEYIKFDGDGDYFITGSSSPFKRAKITLSGSESNADINRYKSKRTDSVTVAANSYVTVTVKVELDSGSFGRYSSVFKNGFYIEGFVWLEPVGGIHNALSIPYMGFCGDWEDAPVFEGEANSEYGCFYTQKVVSYSKVSSTESIIYQLGRSAFIENDQPDPSLVMISPNGDGNGDYLALMLRPLRNVKRVTVEISSMDGETLFYISEDGHVAKSYYNDDSEDLTGMTMHYLWNGSDYTNYFYTMPDGEYKLSVYSVLEGGGDTASEWSVNFYVDTVSPVVEDCYITEDNRLHLTLSDDNRLQYAAVYVNDEYIDDIYAPEASESQSNATISFDISKAGDVPYIYLDVADFAMNVTTVRIDL